MSQVEAVDPRPVVDGGQTITVWHAQQPDAATVFLDQVLDVDGGPDAILGREQVRNGSGRVVADRFTITVDAAEAIRAALAAPGQVENVGRVRNVGRVETIGLHVATGPQTEAPGQMAR